MKYYIFILLFLITISINSQELFTGKVITVHDGDTITVLKEDKTQVKVRLWGIDCPEDGQAYGKKAKQRASELIFDKDVHTSIIDVDRYGRLVCMIFYFETFKEKSIIHCMNEEMLSSGFAWVYKKYCKEPYESEWLVLEKAARDKKQGLWADDNPIPPWEWRKNK